MAHRLPLVFLAVHHRGARSRSLYRNGETQMKNYILKISAPLALSFALVLGACGGGDDAADSLAADTAGLSRDLDLANRDSTPVTGTGDVPANTASKAPASKAAATPPRTTTPPAKTTTPAPAKSTTTPSGNTVTPGAGKAATTGTVSAGTTINLSAGQRICTNTHKAGDRFVATVRETVTGTNGVSIPAGSRASVRVVSVKKSENARDAAQIVLEVLNVSVGGTTYPIQGNIASAEVAQGERSGKDAQKVAIGAAIGAGIGQVLGKDTKSTVIGAATGAAAGTAVAMGTANYEGCIPEGGRITLNLTAPATIGVSQ